MRVTVTDVPNDTPPPANRAPSFTTSAAQSVSEDTTAVATLAASDPDGDPVLFTITGGSDAAHFSLTGASLGPDSGASLDFVTAPDYESPADADADNVYEVTVEASDERGGTASLALRVTVTDVAEPSAGTLRLVGGSLTLPGRVEGTCTPGSDCSSTLDGRVEVYLSGRWGTVCDDRWDDTDATVACRQLGYHSGTAHGLAHFGQGSGPIWLDNVSCTGRESRLIDCPYNPNTSLCGHYEDAGVTCTVNRAPSFTTSAAQRVAENTTVVVTLAASDPNGDSVTFTIAGGSDSARFSLTRGGRLVFVSAPDYESPADADGDNVYEVTVEASDGLGGTSSLALRVTVTDVVNDTPPPANRAPSFTTSAAQSVAEDTTAVVTLAASDADNDPVTFTITGGSDSAHFTLTGASLAFGTAPDYESPADADEDNVYEVTVEASDERGGTASLALRVTVTDVTEPSTGALRLVGGTSALEGRVEVYNNGQWGTVCDDHFGDTDATVACRQLGHHSGTAHGLAHFGQGSGPIWMDNVACTGSESRLIDCPYSTNTSLCGHYEDAGVTCTANGAPSFTTSAAQSVPENTTVVVTPAASDPNGDPVTFTITGGADQARFSLTTGGRLIFVSAPDYESPADADGDNVYEVTVQASDGLGGTSSLALRVTVTDVPNDTPPPPNSAPSFTTTAAQSVAEDTTAVVTLAASDADNDPVTFTITGGSDSARFSLTGASLAFVTAPDYESPADANEDNVYEVTVQASDERGGTASLALRVTVTDVTEPSTGSLRLVGGSSALEGRVEVYNSGQWGTVCDDRWDDTDATVACKQLGYDSGTAHGLAHFGQGSGPIWMDNVACTGSETRLIDCPYNANTSGCRHYEDAGVTCTQEEQ